MVLSGEDFSAKGLRIIEKNYLEIYENYQRITENILPDLQPEEDVDIIAIIIKEGKTSPPLPLAEQDLISQMDKLQIGTDATIHEHVKTI